MVSKFVLGLTVLVVISVASAGSNDDKLKCIKTKYENSLGQEFTTCHTTRQDLPIPRMKFCFTDIMKTKNVVRTANRQMTVDREAFGKFGRDNNSTMVGRAMVNCYNSHPAGDDMYKEAARASQCVFEKLKTGC